MKGATPEVLPPGTEIAESRPVKGTLAIPQGLDPAMARLMEIALEKGTVESLEKLVALSERVEGRRAGQEFGDAKAKFQNACPSIRKTSTAKITSRKTGTSYSYAYAELDEIAATVRPHLHNLGLSYSWDSKVEAGKIRVVCTLRHLNGHSETATFECPVDGNDSMSDPQKYASTLTFARRYSLIQVLGLTTCDPDDDAGKPLPPAAVAGTTEAQAADLRALLEETKVPEDAFVKRLGVASVEEIPPDRYDAAVRALRERAKVAR